MRLKAADTGIIVLAAGNSSRLGKPKQLLFFERQTLIGRLVAEALKASLEPVIVVAGAYAEQVTEALNGTQAEIVFNPDWATGMASGIVLGMKKIAETNPALRQVIISVCDQPYLNARVFDELMDQQRISGRGIVASEYAGILGTPVLLNNRYFSYLLALKSGETAKKILVLFADDVIAVPFLRGSTDIDTAEDYAILLKQQAGIDDGARSAD